VKFHPGFEDLKYRKRRDHIAANLAETCEDILYLETENKTWTYIFAELNKLYTSSACSPYRSSLGSLNISSELIPQFSQINKELAAHNFRVHPVEGLIETRRFMEKLSEGTMLCTRYIRHHSSPHYTPEPDIVHEVMGHCVFFADPKYRELNRAFGEAALKANDDDLEKIAKVYWYTVEFGICTEDCAPKAWGAGLLSSIKELSNIDSIPTEVLDLQKLTNTDYDTMNPHAKLYKSTQNFYNTADTIISFLHTFKF
jgi:phenylalanine-4-hydroxylase